MAALIQKKHPSDNNIKSAQQLIADSQLVQDTVKRYRTLPFQSLLDKLERRTVLSLLVAQFNRNVCGRTTHKRKETDGKVNNMHNNIVTMPYLLSGFVTIMKC